MGRVFTIESFQANQGRPVVDLLKRSTGQRRRAFRTSAHLPRRLRSSKMRSRLSRRRPGMNHPGLLSQTQHEAQPPPFTIGFGAVQQATRWRSRRAFSGFGRLTPSPQKTFHKPFPMDAERPHNQPRYRRIVLKLSGEAPQFPGNGGDDRRRDSPVGGQGGEGRP